MVTIINGIKKEGLKIFKFLSALFLAYKILQIYGVEVNFFEQIIRLIIIGIALFWGMPSLMNIFEYALRRIRKSIKEIHDDIKDIKEIRKDLKDLQKDTETSRKLLEESMNEYREFKKEFEDMKKKVFGFTGGYHGFDSINERLTGIEKNLGISGFHSGRSLIERIRELERKFRI